MSVVGVAVDPRDWVPLNAEMDLLRAQSYAVAIAALVERGDPVPVELMDKFIYAHEIAESHKS